MSNKTILLAISFLLCLVSCKDTAHQKQQDVSNPELPILSPKKDGEYQVIADFEFKNQYNQTITQNAVKGKIYIAEFFFTSCPSICPIVSVQLKEVYHTFKDEENFMILSHSIDPENDTVNVLQDYYTNTLEIDKPSNWQLLTGKKEKVHDLANFSYGTVVYEDLDRLKDNIMHSGALLLVDENGLIRGMYDGKDSTHTKRLIKDVKQLLSDLN
ncbi:MULTISPECIES: SCO family protein [unclassified Lacinutrix]